MMIKKEDSLRAKTKTPATSLLLITGAKVWYRKMLFSKLYIDYIIYYRFSTENYRKKITEKLHSLSVLYTIQLNEHSTMRVLCKVKYFLHHIKHFFEYFQMLIHGSTICQRT